MESSVDRKHVPGSRVLPQSDLAYHLPDTVIEVVNVNASVLRHFLYCHLRWFVDIRNQGVH